MSCNCEQKDKGFAPRAFIPEPKCCPVMFRAVKIPASLGDDTVVKPENGLYRNVILNYEANGHTYIYSSDGIPVRIDGKED